MARGDEVPWRDEACDGQGPFHMEVVGSACGEGVASPYEDPCRFDHEVALTSCEASCALEVVEDADRQSSCCHIHLLEQELEELGRQKGQEEALPMLVVQEDEWVDSLGLTWLGSNERISITQCGAAGERLCW